MATVDGSSELNSFIQANYALVEGDHRRGLFRGSDEANFKASNRTVNCGSFYISNKETSVAEYMSFLKENNGAYKGLSLYPSVSDKYEGFLKEYLEEKNPEQLPMIGVSRKQVVAYCEWLNIKLNQAYKSSLDAYHLFCHLPTTANYESAAAEAFKNEKKASINTPPGKEYRRYNKHQSKQKPDKITRNSAPALKIYNLVGNVAEWVLDTPRDEEIIIKIGDKYLSTGSWYFRVPDILKKEINMYGLVKGGAFNQPDFYLQPAVSKILKNDKGYSWVGFRPMIAFYKI